MTAHKKKGTLAISGSLGGVSGAVKIGEDGKLEIQIGIKKRKARK